MKLNEKSMKLCHFPWTRKNKNYHFFERFNQLPSSGVTNIFGKSLQLSVVRQFKKYLCSNKNGAFLKDLIKIK